MIHVLYTGQDVDSVQAGRMASWERRTDRKSQGQRERVGWFEAADEDGKLAMILDDACKERGVGMAIMQKDVEEEICVTVNNSL